MKHILSLFLFVAITQAGFARDVIITKDSKKFTGKVIEVSEDSIKYKSYDTPKQRRATPIRKRHKNDEPVYTLLKKDIAFILYQNGNIEAFEGENTTASNVEELRKPPQGDCVNDPILDLVSVTGDFIFLYGRPIEDKELRGVMRKTSYPLHQQFVYGKRLDKGGSVLLITGSSVSILGIILIKRFDSYTNLFGLINLDSFMDDLGTVLCVIGATEIVASIPLLIVGKSMKKKAQRNFIENCLSDQPEKEKDYPHLNLNVKNSGLALALTF